MTEPHAWELRQHEKAREAAAETVARLERALAEMEGELDYRREALGQIVAERHERGARLVAANQAGARMVFGGASGSPNTAEAAWDGADPSAVRVVADHIVQQPRLDAEESAALGAVGDLERRVSLAQRALRHWQAEAGTDAPPSDRGLVDCAPTGPPTAPEAEPAEAAEMVGASAHSTLSAPPVSGAVSLRDRLAGLAERVQGW